MRTLKSTWHRIGKIFAIIGAAFLVPATIFFELYFNNYVGDRHVFFILLIDFCSIGILFFAIGMCFYLPARRAGDKRNRLKADGLSYDAEIMRVLPCNYVRVSGYVSAHLECSYRNQEGKICLVKSECLLLDYGAFSYSCKADNGSMSAKVYVSRDNPKVYSVEVTAGADIRFDYDYR
jgi:hypothetical protein